jgi:hypothetical protein
MKFLINSEILKIGNVLQGLKNLPLQFLLKIYLTF